MRSAKGFTAARTIGRKQGQFGVALAILILNRENLIQRFFPSFLKVTQGNRYAVGRDICRRGRLTDQADLIAFTPCGSRRTVGFN